MHSVNQLAACFNVATGDVEDAPALDPLAKFDIIEKNGAVYIKGEEATIKASRRQPKTKCSVSGQEKVVVVGGYGLCIPTCSSRANCILCTAAAELWAQFKLFENRVTRAPSL